MKMQLLVIILLSYKLLQKPVRKNMLREGRAKNWESEQLRAALCAMCGYLTCL